MRLSPLDRLAVAGVLAMLLLGCSSDSQSAASDSPELVAFATSPLAEELGLNDISGDIDTIKNEYIVTCMRERGFELPISRQAPQFDDSLIRLQEELGDFEFAKLHGFGAADSGILTSDTPQAIDPVAEYIETLSGPEADSYRSELFGEDPESGLTEDSCLAIATRQTEIDFQLDRQASYGSFYQEVLDRIDADPRVQELNRTYAQCVAEEGLPYTSPREAASAATDRFINWTTSIQFQDISQPTTMQQITGESRQAFDELHRQEVDEALISLQCETNTRAELVKLHTEIEQDWILENGDKITAALES